MLGYNELLKEKCNYEHYIETDKYNEKKYSNVEEVSCFVSFDFSNNLGINQQDTSLSKRVFITNDFEPNIFDKIDGLEVKSYKPVKGLIVPIIGWEILL